MLYCLIGCFDESVRPSYRSPTHLQKYSVNNDNVALSTLRRIDSLDVDVSETCFHKYLCPSPETSCAKRSAEPHSIRASGCY